MLYVRFSAKPDKGLLNVIVIYWCFFAKTDKRHKSFLAKTEKSVFAAKQGKVTKNTLLTKIDF
jgi:hypothetical protein